MKRAVTAFVRFSILANTNLTNGSATENIAHIVFDFNAPIITPPAVFSVDVLASVAEEAGNAFRIYSQPVHDRLRSLYQKHTNCRSTTRSPPASEKAVQASGSSTTGGVNVHPLPDCIHVEGITCGTEKRAFREGVSTSQPGPRSPPQQRWPRVRNQHVAHDHMTTCPYDLMPTQWPSPTAP
ncbi:MAG: hypothetical protein IPF64_18085 [Flavobacteriales bacterium]|nr:hypothetical protein [Flavobacteriales bacterium]